MDRKAFFDGYRAHFIRLTQGQVDGLNLLLDLMQDEPWDTIQHAAYFLATVKHECADTFWPITERGQRDYFNRYEPGTTVAKQLGNIYTGDGYNYRGRGYVQTTGRRNYTNAQKDFGFPFVSYPDGMLWPAMSYKAAKHYMMTGGYTGKSFGNFPLGDYQNYRRIINGTDQADAIAMYARGFEAILREST